MREATNRPGTRARIIAATFAVAFLAGINASEACAKTVRSATAHTTLVGKPAPELIRTDFEGNSIDLMRLRGKVVLLNFWATWCAPCQIEMPTFAAWQRKYGAQGFQVIGISMDDSATPARRLVDRLKADYPIAMGDARLAERYGGVLGLPLTFLVDRRGIVRQRFEGEINSAVIEKQVKLLLAAPVR